MNEKIIENFLSLCAIPHKSHHEEKISRFLCDWAVKKGLAAVRDEEGNVIIDKAGSAGHENAPRTILQAHMDMVVVWEDGMDFDPLNDTITVINDGKTLKAKGTSLGGDDGAGVALAMSILEDETAVHGPIRAIFTVDEETGMYGAEGLDVSVLKGRRMLNMDSEDEGIFTVSCAGGARADCCLPVTRSAFSAPVLEISVTGLVGGHSGAEIDKGRANATITLGRVLQALVDELEVRLVSAEGGLKDNAIPNAARAVIALEEGKLPRAQEICAELQDTFRREYAAADPDVTVTFTPGTVASQALTLRDTKKVCCFLGLYPNGIESMSMDIPGLVQTSCNLGIFKVNGSGLEGSGSVRSSIASRKQLLLRRIGLLAEGLDGTLCVSGEYPAWEYRRESHLRDVMCKVYKDQYGQDMKVEAIHAGLECGLFCGKIPGLDAVSFGPNLYDIHTTSERMSISSVQRVYAYLCAVLQALKD